MFLVILGSIVVFGVSVRMAVFVIVLAVVFVFRGGMEYIVRS